MARKLLTVLVVLFATVLHGQLFYFDHITTQDGLLSDQVNDVIVTSDHRLWVATQAGLHVYEQERWTALTDVMPSQYIRSLTQSGDTLYVTNDVGIQAIPLKGPIHPQTIISCNDPEYENIRYADRILVHNNILITTGLNNGLSLFKNGKEIPAIAPHPDQKIADLKIFNNRIYVLRNERLTVCDFNGSCTEKSSYAGAQTLYFSKNNVIIAGTTLYILNSDLERIYSQALEINITALDTFDHYMIAGTASSGLYALIITSSKATLYPIYSNNDIHRVNEIPLKGIQNLRCQGSRVYVASSTGAAILSHRLFQNIKNLPSGSTTSICPGNENHQYINFGEVYEVGPDIFGKEAAVVQKAEHGTISSFFAGSEDVWAGTSTGMLQKRNTSGAVIKEWDFSDRGEGVFYIHQDPDDNVWFTQAPADKPIKGLAAITPAGRVTFYGEEQGLISRTLVVKTSQRKRTYAGGIGTAGYLYQYIPETDRWRNISKPFQESVSDNFEVHDIAIDQDEGVWLATTDGLFFQDIDRVRRIPLPDDPIEIRAIAIDKHNKLWLSSDTEGVYYYDRTEVVSFKEQAGLPSKIMAYRSLLFDQHDQLWAGTAEGVVWADIDNINTFKTSATDVTSIPTSVSYASRESASIPVYARGYHHLPTIHQYRLDEGEWLTINDNMLDASLFPLGSHELTIRSKHIGGYIWSVPHKFSLTILQEWYKRTSSIFGLFLLAGGAISLIFWYTQRNYKSHLNRVMHAIKNQTILNQKRITRQQEEVTAAHSEQRKYRYGASIIHHMIRNIPPGLSFSKQLDEMARHLRSFPSIHGFYLLSEERAHYKYEGSLFKSALHKEFAYSKKEYKQEKAVLRLPEPVSRRVSDINLAITEHLRPIDFLHVFPLMHKGQSCAFIIVSPDEDFLHKDQELINIFLAYFEQIHPVS